jgi:fluoroacetyl-CoA thioesterase
MPKPSLVPGLRHIASLTITEDLTVPRVSARLQPFADMPPVFATAFMVAFVEATCIACVRGHLDEGEHTVGTHVDISHTAVTAVGGTAAAAVELVEVSGRKLVFSVEVRDEAGQIGAGRHERAVIDIARFLDGVRRRASTPGQPHG